MGCELSFLTVIKVNRILFLPLGNVLKINYKLLIIKVKQIVHLPWMGKVAKPDGVIQKALNFQDDGFCLTCHKVTPSQPAVKKDFYIRLTEQSSDSPASKQNNY